MTRQITKDDIYLKARMFAEGVRFTKDGILYPKPVNDMRENSPCKLDMRDPEEMIKSMGEAKYSGFDEFTDHALGNVMILDDTGIPLPIFPDENSALELRIDDEQAVLTEKGKELARGVFYTPHRPWDDETLSNGQPIQTVLPGMSSAIVNVLFNLSCDNFNSGKGCRYCGLFSNNASRQMGEVPLETIKVWARYQAEAIKTLTDYGWRGALAISGGSLTPSQRPNYLKHMETVILPIRNALGEKTFKELLVVYNHYPPEDFKDMYEWKELGITGTCIDLEVVNDESFRKVCPGKSAYRPFTYWKESQEASVEVFGAYLNTSTNIVAGIDPMDELLERVDERLSKGVLVIPLTFFPDPGSPMKDEQPPDAAWQMEAAEKITDVYFRHGLKIVYTFAKEIIPALYRRYAPEFLVGPKKNESTSADLWLNGNMQDTHLTVVFDEMIRRLSKVPLLGPKLNIGIDWVGQRQAARQ